MSKCLNEQSFDKPAELPKKGNIYIRYLQKTT